MLGGLADRITCLGISMMVAKDSASAKISELGCKRLDAEMKFREKMSSKKAERKEKKTAAATKTTPVATMTATEQVKPGVEKKDEKIPTPTISEMEDSFKEELEKKFGIKIVDFEDSENKSDYDEKWASQFYFLSSFITKVKNSYDSETGDFEKDISTDEVRTWLRYMCDESVAKNMESFQKRHKSDILIRLIDDVNEILYSFYPGYEDMYLDQEQELQNETDKAVEEKLRNGGEIKMPRVLMIRLPRSKMKLNPEADGRGGVYPEPEPIPFGERVKKAAEAATTDKK